MNVPRISRVAGAIADVRPMPEARMYDLVRIGKEGLLGEIIRIDRDTATVQVFEDTNGLELGGQVEPIQSALTAELGPGLIGSVLDGIGRPLERLAVDGSSTIQPGRSSPTLDREQRWTFVPTRGGGESVKSGDILGFVEERPGFKHHIMVPPNRSGELTSLEPGVYTVLDTIGMLRDGTRLRLAHSWQVRTPRPFLNRLATSQPFVTGQRIFDLLFPVARGGSVAVPGGFGTGKTVIEQSLAKFAEADLVLYIGCGERGNEMAEVLSEFPTLVDHRTGGRVMDRTVLVVNTSNMPVAARESSVYLGITIAEYYRDMGYHVAVMADSLSRWAEALREMSGRLREMPGEEGYPTSLPNRLGKVYERAGRTTSMGMPKRDGSVTLVSAISPGGGDFSEPVTQASLRVAGALWALDPELAHQRQFPAVDWETSYSLYTERLSEWFNTHVHEGWNGLRHNLLGILQRDREIREIAGLVGADALEDKDRLIIVVGRLVRETVLGQSAFEPNDAYSPLYKTFQLARLAQGVLVQGTHALEQGRSFDDLEFSEVSRCLLQLRNAVGDLKEEVGQVEAALAAMDHNAP